MIIYKSEISFSFAISQPITQVIHVLKSVGAKTHPFLIPKFTKKKLDNAPSALAPYFTVISIPEYGPTVLQEYHVATRNPRMHHNALNQTLSWDQLRLQTSVENHIDTTQEWTAVE